MLDYFQEALNNIQSINWSFAGDKRSGGNVQRNDLDKNLIEIKRKNGDSSKTTCFLRYQKRLPNHGKLKCGLAFNVEHKKDNLKILPIQHGKLCIFFPADKEHTGFRFHINGPYASSIDRASIKYEDEDNVEIIATTAGLLVDGLKDIKKRGLLGLDVLEILPNGDDEVNDFFTFVWFRLVQSFKTEPLVPTRDGSYCSANELVYGPKIMSDLFSNQQMSFLSGYEGKKWAIGAIKNSRAHKFLSSLEIPTWDEDSLVSEMDSFFGKNHYYWLGKDKRPEGNKWISAQDDWWIVEFYLLLRRILKKNDSEHKSAGWKIIRTDKGHFFGNQVYFIQDDSEKDYELPIIKNALLDNLRSERRNNLKSFFIWSGAREIGEKQAIESILSKHYNLPPGKVVIAKSTHIRHMRQFVKWFREAKDIALFEGFSILRTNDPDDEACYKPSTLFLDEPFLKTSLSYLFENQGSPLHQKKWSLWSEYKTIKGFVEFVGALGVLKSIEIMRTNASRRDQKGRRHGGLLELYFERWSSYKVDEDYDIEGLDDLLKKPDIKVSQLIWKTMSNARESFLKARFRPNKSSQIRTAPSTLVEQLKNNAWLPTKNGEFRKPKDMSKKLLAKGFDFNDVTGWLDEIGFGEKEQAESQQEKEKLAKLKSLGLSKKVYEMAMKMKDDPDLLVEFQEALEKKANKADFPERPSTDPTRRAKKAKESVDGAPDVEREEKKRMVRTSASNIDKRSYLIEKYSNDDGQMVCQICKDEMPFRKRDNEYYFEAVEALKGGSKEHASNFLALCPVCAAKFKEWIKKHDDSAKLFAERVLDEDGLDVSIDMCDKPYTVSFVEQHRIDLHAYLADS